jgi:hypothetical protein
MNRSGHKVLSLFFVLIVVCGCAGSAMQDQQAGASETEDIAAALKDFESAWNKHDEEAVLELLDEEFIIWAGGTRIIQYTKGSYAFRLRDIMIEYRYIKLGRPAVWLKGETATVSVPMSIDARNVRSTFRLKRENDRWLFLDWEF